MANLRDSEIEDLKLEGMLGPGKPKPKPKKKGFMANLRDAELEGLKEEGFSGLKPPKKGDSAEKAGFSGISRKAGGFMANLRDFDTKERVKEQAQPQKKKTTQSPSRKTSKVD